MQNLVLKSAEGLDVSVRPLHAKNVELSSPAVSVMNDFSQHTPALIPAGTSVEDAVRWLDTEKFPWQLVVGTNQEVIGLLEKGADVEQTIMSRVAHGDDRAHLSAKDVMLPLSKMHCLGYEALVQANVDDLIKALQKSGVRFCLVLEASNRVCGLISVQEVLERLGVNLHIRHAPTFVDIFHAIHP